MGNFFMQLCSRTLKVDILKQMKVEIAVILCKIEQIFSLAFFEVMVHLVIHLPRKAELGGSVQNCWMYPMEMMLGKHKRRVQNKAQPEDSIVEAYLVDECLTFCSMSLRGIETR
jgi:hypothetical protein